MPTIHPGLGQPDPEVLITCPYNPSHRVAFKRMQFHITKCRKGHPGEKKECLFNATHMINEQEFQFHLQTCPDRGVIDNYTYSAPKDNAHVIESLPEPVVPPTEENWDDEHYESYDPSTRAMESEVIHVLIGATPSERKKHKHLQRQKFRALEESNSTTSHAPKPEKKIEQPLRRPNSIGVHLKNSAECAAMNRSFTSAMSDSCVSTSTKQGKRAVASSSSSDDDKIPNLVPSNSWEGHNRPGRSQTGDDGFTVIRSRGRRNGK